MQSGYIDLITIDIIIDRHVKKITIYKERIVIEFNIATAFSIKNEIKY